MVERRPAPILVTAAWQVLSGLILLVKAAQIGSPVAWLMLSVYGVWHLATAVGLYNLSEWARQRAVQLSLFDLLMALSGLVPHPYPLGTLLKIGMPLYTVTALNDGDLRRRFS